MLWFRPIILALGRLKKEYYHKFRASLYYIMLKVLGQPGLQKEILSHCAPHSPNQESDVEF